MMKEPIFRDTEVQSQFDRDGFVKIALLSNVDVIALSAIYAGYFPEPFTVFHSSSYLKDFDVKIDISNAIRKIIEPRLEQHFTNFRLLGSAYLTKGCGRNSEMPMHQDWTIVDEEKYVAVNVWTPLCDTDVQNGTLELVQGSHLWTKALRAPSIPFYFDGYQELIKSKLTIVPTYSTEAVIINQATIHYSKPNLSDKPRIAITTGLVTHDAPLIFNYWNKDRPNHVEKFSQEDDFLLKFEDFHRDIFERPSLGKSLGYVQYRRPPLSDEEVYRFLGLSPQRKSISRFEYFKNLFRI
jgi:hypothetical protein